MNKITFQHPNTKETVATKDFTTAMNLMKRGFVIIPHRGKLKGESKNDNAN